MHPTYTMRWPAGSPHACPSLQLSCDPPWIAGPSHAFCLATPFLMPAQGSIPSLSTQASSAANSPGKRGRAEQATERFRRSSRPRRPAPEKAKLLFAETPRVTEEDEERPAIRANSLRPNQLSTSSPSEFKHTRHASLDGPSRRKPPTVPLLALNKVGVARDAPSAPRTESHHAGPSHVRQPSLTLPTRARAPPLAGQVLRTDGRGFEPFSDDVQACAQPLLQHTRVPAQHRQQYREWLAQALLRHWIEEVEQSRCHILLKPKFVRRPEGNVKFVHDCTLVNAMATREMLCATHQSPEVIHQWARTVAYLGRIELVNASLTIPLASSQRRYYAFVGESGSGRRRVQYYRYKRMPPQAQGAGRYLQLCIGSMLDRLPGGLRRRVMYRGEEIFCGGASASECEEVLTAVRKWLDVYDFQVLMCKGIDTPVTACLGLLHDRQFHCLHIAEQRLVQISAVIAEMRTERWVEATSSLLSLLSPITSILPPEWVKECGRLRKLVTSKSRQLKLPSTICLLWDHWASEAAEWEIPFHASQ